MSDTLTQEKLGRFNWHPDPVIDFEVEIEAIEGAMHDVIAGTGDPDALTRRITNAMATVWITEDGRSAKEYLRRILADYEAKVKS